MWWPRPPQASGKFATGAERGFSQCDSFSPSRRAYCIAKRQATVEHGLAQIGIRDHGAGLGEHVRRVPLAKLSDFSERLPLPPFSGSG